MKPSIWELETFYRNRDVIIIGAGFTGLWSAISIKEKFPEQSILVVERSFVPMGASTRNAGFACFGSLTEIIADVEKMGWPKTLDLIRMRFEGLQKIQTYFKAEEIDFENCGGFEILNDEMPLQRIEEINEKLKTITGLEKTFFLSPEKIAQFGLKSAGYLVENPCEGSLHSGKLIQKLLERCQKLGIEFLFGTEILEISEDENLVKIITENFQIQSEKLVTATNAFATDLISNIDLFPVRGQILLTEPIENLKLKGTFHYDEGFIYFRNLGNRILLGGARNQDFETEKTISLETTEFLQNYLAQFLKEVILPDQEFKISSQWSGIMAMGTEKSPIVEKISDRQIAAVRLSGMGVALAPKIGEMVAEMI
ncbi:NAD(P)/FAD-dependent oxidoreductase [Kaistella jeonii]|uniref:FAD dependent oxidoreductase domain-containing protein n=1 Tax=Kaistella jeonii TaxID=266749 RepID=A0A0C1CVU4_9FLAO|nr:FAD-dependent oxidoreductase [Kaistella jeonii]KIA88456.1 hypothetical protein OA86_10485 [Kaistella jeonii]SFC17476.1 Glycine/D-amino acid oxidase [Kaistella jeonii]VEI95422.1 Gamma-glutamylputrescine oxidoreductase [Kaistella jeonii]